MSQPTPPAGPTTIPDHQNQLHSITLETRNFRALRLTNWTPSGVCVVVGPNGAGKTTLLTLIDPKWNQPCPLALAPDGWITGLLHLTAVAGAPKGSLIAIDDFGNDLHPYAIRKLTEAFREWAEERDLIVCLASHSPVLLDEFKDQPGSVFVMEQGLEKRPVPLTELYEPEWLARFSLGRLYEHGEFGGQRQRINGTAWTSYDQLCVRLLDILTGDILPLPSWNDRERHEQQIAIAVSKATGITPEHWAKLDHPSREPWLERTIHLLTKQQPPAVGQRDQRAE